MVPEKEVTFDIEVLYKRAKNGDSKAENVLLRLLHESFLLIVQHRIWKETDHEDIVQDTIVTILSKYKSLEIESSFAGWSYRVLNNKILDYVQKKTIRKRLEEQRKNEKEPVLAGDPDLKKRLIECFRKISGTNLRHARILNLHYQGYTTEEICSKLNIKKNNTYVLLNRARAALEQCLGKGKPDYE